MPRVSIVIPVFNTETLFLEEAVASALRQTYPDIEIVIVDDGSTREETLGLLEELRKKDSIQVVRQSNSGPSAARNTGIAAATGEYILPLDADDVIEPTYVQQAYEAMEKNPKLGLVYCRADYIGAWSGPWELPDYSYPEILLGNCIFCTALFRKSDWEKVGGYKTVMRLGWEDYEFFLSLIERGLGVYCIPQVLFHYRKHGPSRTTNTESNENMEILWSDIRRYHRCLFFKNYHFLHKRHSGLYETWKRLSFLGKCRELFRL